MSELSELKLNGINWERGEIEFVQQLLMPSGGLSTNATGSSASAATNTINSVNTNVSSVGSVGSVGSVANGATSPCCDSGRPLMTDPVIHST